MIGSKDFGSFGKNESPVAGHSKPTQPIHIQPLSRSDNGAFPSVSSNPSAVGTASPLFEEAVQEPVPGVQVLEDPEF
jgi:hypothetical protein